MALHAENEGQGFGSDLNAHPQHVQGTEARVRGLRRLHPQGRRGEDQGVLRGKGSRIDVRVCGGVRGGIDDFAHCTGGGRNASS